MPVLILEEEKVESVLRVLGDMDECVAFGQNVQGKWLNKRSFNL